MENENVAPSDNSQGKETTTEATTEHSDGQTQSTTSYMDGRFDSVTALEQGLTTSEKRYEDYRSMNDKRFGSFVGSPEAYEMNEGLEASDSLQAYARENQFSNDALNGLVEFYNGEMNTRNEAFATAQREALGTDADARLNNVQDWAKANLGADAMDAFKGMITSVKSVEMFEQIMKMNNGTAPAQVSQPKTIVDRDTVKSMRYATDEYGGRKMSSDPTYRAKVEKMEAEFISGGGKL